MPFAKIVDHYKVEDVDIKFQCPNCGYVDSQRFRSNLKDIVTFCDQCECTIVMEVMVCPSCNSSKYVNSVVNQDRRIEIRCTKCDSFIAVPRGWTCSRGNM